LPFSLQPLPSSLDQSTNNLFSHFSIPNKID
jgi:hypothetical protein